MGVFAPNPNEKRDAPCFLADWRAFGTDQGRACVHISVHKEAQRRACVHKQARPPQVEVASAPGIRSWLLLLAATLTVSDPGRWRQQYRSEIDIETVIFAWQRRGWLSAPSGPDNRATYHPRVRNVS